MASAEGYVRRRAKEVFPDPRDQAYAVGLARQESNFDPAAWADWGNGKGAAGVYQFAEEMRAKYNLDRNSPAEKQVDAGLDYLSTLHRKHKGSWDDILAEHYMGLPRYNRWKKGETDPEIRSFQNSHLPLVKRKAHESLSFEEVPPEPTLIAGGASKILDSTPENVASVVDPPMLSMRRRPLTGFSPAATSVADAEPAPEREKKAGSVWGSVLENFGSALSTYASQHNYDEARRKRILSNLY
jgi:hypothetical protein